MKKTILIFAGCLLAITSVKAQLAKGNLFIGTGLGTTTYNFGTYTYTYPDANVKTQDEKDYSLTLSPSIGVFLTDHLIFGGSLGLSYSNEKINETSTIDNYLVDNTTSNTTTATIGPFVRYYFFDAQPTKTVFYFQADAGVGFGGGSSTGSTLSTANTSATSSGNINGLFIFKAGGALGLTHFIQKNIGLDVSVGYTYDDESYNTTANTQSTTAGGVVSSASNSFKAKVPQNGIALSAGFHFFIPNKAEK
jgi:hypothetical protein